MTRKMRIIQKHSQNQPFLVVSKVTRDTAQLRKHISDLAETAVTRVTITSEEQNYHRLGDAVHTRRDHHSLGRSVKA